MEKLKKSTQKEKAFPDLRRFPFKPNEKVKFSVDFHNERVEVHKPLKGDHCLPKQNSPFIPISVLLKEKDIKLPALLDPMIRQSLVNVLCGGSDVGKSFFCLNLAVAIAQKQEEFIGFPLTVKHGKSLMIFTEDGEKDIAFRTQKLLKGKSISNDGIKCLFFEGGNLIQMLENELKINPVDLVVIDSFGDVFTGDINQSIPVRQFFKPFKLLARKYDCAVLFLHHIGKHKDAAVKPSKNDVLGSQGIESASRSVMMLAKKDNNNRILTIVKGNSIDEKEKNVGFELTFSPEEGFKRTGQVVTPSKGKRSKLTEEQEKKILEKYNELKSLRGTSIAVGKLGIQAGRSKISKVLDKHNVSVKTPAKKAARQD